MLASYSHVLAKFSQPDNFHLRARQLRLQSHFFSEWRFIRLFLMSCDKRQDPNVIHCLPADTSCHRTEIFEPSTWTSWSLLWHAAKRQETTVFVHRTQRRIHTHPTPLRSITLSSIIQGKSAAPHGLASLVRRQYHLPLMLLPPQKPRNNERDPQTKLFRRKVRAAHESGKGCQLRCAAELIVQRHRSSQFFSAPLYSPISTLSMGAVQTTANCIVITYIPAHS